MLNEIDFFAHLSCNWRHYIKKW